MRCSPDKQIRVSQKCSTRSPLATSKSRGYRNFLMAGEGRGAVWAPRMMIEDRGSTSIKAGAWKSLDRREPEEPGWGGRSDTSSVADSLPINYMA